MACSCDSCRALRDDRQASSIMSATLPYRTQKARGVAALNSWGEYDVPDFEIFPVEHFDNPTQPVHEYEEWINPYSYVYMCKVCKQKRTAKIHGVDNAYKELVNRFVRPCPVTPRHGFVDSRFISTVEEAQQIVAEAKSADPQAEILVMPRIRAEYSGIWTNGKLVIGTGNDGATAGKDSKAIAVQGKPSRQESLWANLLEKAGVTESPYMELLWARNSYDGYHVKAVQLRNGPALPDTVDYIPDTFEIKHIVLAEGDLLEWETKVKRFEPGTVVYHPGGSLASHYAVHAVLSSVPVIISYEPKVGETLKANTTKHKPNLTKIKAGFVLGATMKMHYTTAARCMLAGCHSTATWLGVHDLLLGVAAGCAYRLIITAGLGEARHKPGRRRKPSRDAVYDNVWNKVLAQSTRTRYLMALKSFEHDDWSSSFGGKKWLELSRHAGRIMDALLDKDSKKLLQALNVAVNAVHNGGWAFDKFIGRSEMDAAAVSPATAALKCGPALYQALLREGEATELAKWFKKRRHFKFDEAKAAKEEAAEEEASSCDCGEHSCELCYPDGCKCCCEVVIDRSCDCGEHECSSCYPDGCDCDCKICHDYGKGCSICLRKMGEIVEAQAHVNDVPKWNYVDENYVMEPTLYVQYKHENMLGKPYFSKSVNIPKDKADAVKEWFANAEKSPSLSNPWSQVKKYVKLTKDGNLWRLGYVWFSVDLRENG